MTRVSKKIVAWILGVVAFFAIAFGIVIARPQVKTAKAADTAVTFSAAALGDASHETYGTSIRFDTSGAQWTSYHNWVSAADWASIADYTTVNGRTVTEINNATTHTQKITLMMQPAGSFSFLRLYIPAEIIPLGEVKSMGILDGWSFNNGTSNYTASAVTFLRNGDTMVTSGSFSAVTKLTASDITISEAKLINPSNAALGTDSYIVNIDIGQEIASEYDTMYGTYKTIRNAIYINGKSIEEWNSQKLAEDPRFNDPSMYTRFPQNSTDPSHLETFVKPVGFWGTSTGFRLSIFQELVADCETVTVTVGAGCTFAGKFMVSESKSATVLTQSVVDITSGLSIQDFGTNTAGTEMYRIKTNVAAWEKSPLGGCLNEYDPSNAGGGQIQMKYLYFGDTSFWDINKNDNGAYGSEQGNIAGGSIYAPILVEMGLTEGYSYVQIRLPSGYPDTGASADVNHQSFTIKKGFNVVEDGVSYYVKNDVVFTNDGASNWKTEVKGKEIETEVTGIVTKANRTDGGSNENFVIFQISNNDYLGCNTTPITDISSLFGYIDIGGTIIESYQGEKFFNVWNIGNSVAFRFADHTTLQNVPYITIKAGAKFPSYTTQNGGVLTYFVTQEDVTFIHDVPNDTWTVGEWVEEETIDTAIKSINVVSSQLYITLTNHDFSTAVAEDAERSQLEGYILFDGEAADLDAYEYFSYQNDGSFILAGGSFSSYSSITILAGAKFPAFTAKNTFYVTTQDITFVKDNGVWKDETTVDKSIDISDELTFVDQGTLNVGTETYLIKTNNAYWTKAPQGGCLNEHDPDGLGGGQEQMKYLYFNGTSLYEINKNDHYAYGAEQGNIASGGIYAPILVMMGLAESTYSYIQLHVPTGYPNTDLTADKNHQSFEIKAGFTVTEGENIWKVAKDIKWVNLNGSWVKEDNTFAADTVTIGNPRIDGVAKELYKVDITSDSWNITCNNFDFMYGAKYEGYRKLIFINGVSIYDINANTDDSSYVYSTGPMTSTEEPNRGYFANPVLIETYTGNYNASGSDRADDAAPTNKITLWIHKDYMHSLVGDITITLGAGFNAFTTNDDALAEDVNYSMVATVSVDGEKHKVIKGNTFTRPSNPVKDMTETTIYTFDNWYIVNTDEVYNSMVITEDIAIEARYTETAVALYETEVKEVFYRVEGEDNGDRWLVFYLSNHDYPEDTALYNVSYEELQRLGLLEHIILYGTISVGGVAKTEATLAEIFAANGSGEAIYLNIWDTENYWGTLAFRTPGVSTITSVVIEEGAFFPSYQYISGGSTDDARYAVMRTTTYNNMAEDGLKGSFKKLSGFEYDIQMGLGAAVRVTSDMSTSGIRFRTNISKESVTAMQEALNNGTYKEVSFGTLIVPTSYLKFGRFTHEWLDENGLKKLDIPSTAGFYKDSNGQWDYNWPKEEGDYFSYFGSIVSLKVTNYNKSFSGIGYIKIVTKDGETVYVYAKYDAKNSRSASFIANAATNDRSGTSEGEYKHYISENNNYSPYTETENGLIAQYIVVDNTNAVSYENLSNLANMGGTQTITPATQKLAGPYVELVYSTNVNVHGVFTYTDGSKTAQEDFYLQAGTTSHRQYLDIFRDNGVGYGMNTANLSMTSIKFTNAELKVCSGNVKIFGLYSQNKTIVTSKQEVYVTRTQKDGSEMTVGAHLGLGGSFTYLAKSGIYEGVTGQTENSSYNQSIFGYTKYKYNTGSVVLSKDTSVFDENHATGNKTTEAAYYGHATSSKAADGAVNLINNFDAGRQIQQSWYAQVGGSDDATNGENGYTRADCTTGATADKPSQYWPYNPVQAGDVVSNPAQIIDYEVVEGEYIYVKARAMDWAKGKGSDNLEGTIEGGSTTKSYMENYYRLNDDGTVIVDNTFVDWNGFTDMETCNWASTELPAVYPIQTLNYYVSNTNGDGSWEDGLEYKNDMMAWTGGTAYHQFANPAQGDTKVEDWFAWANGGNGNALGMGVYIPNVTQYTSGRSSNSTGLSVPYNCNALSSNILLKKGLMSNMQTIGVSYKSAYVSNTSYTAPGILFRMEAYVPIEYSYVVCVDSVTNIRTKFKEIKEKGTVTNAGNEYEKVGLDAWARADKKWTW